MIIGMVIKYEGMVFIVQMDIQSFQEQKNHLESVFKLIMKKSSFLVFLVLQRFGKRFFYDIFSFLYILLTNHTNQRDLLA